MAKQGVYCAIIGADGASVGEPDDGLFPLWSFGKTLLATAALRLVDQGLLTLDTTLPGKPYTLRQLLQHTSGVDTYGVAHGYHEAVARGDTPWSRDELIERVGQTLLFEPGAGWSYSNIGYLFIRELVEETVGAPISVAVGDLVFDPLEVGSLSFAENKSDLSRSVWGNAAGYDPGWVYHGLFLGDPRDAARLMREILCGSLLPTALKQPMQTPRPLGGPLPGRPWTETGYGLGLMIGKMEGANCVMGHNGNGPGSICLVHHYPGAAGRTIALFAQGDDEGRLEREALGRAIA
jgi:CubicO group peptidase (beta-lactamase class C family)